MLKELRSNYVRRNLPAPLQNLNADFRPFINIQYVYRPCPFFWDGLRIFGPHEKKLILFSKTELFTHILETRDSSKCFEPDKLREYLNERRRQLKFFFVWRSLNIQNDLFGLWSHPFSDSALVSTENPVNFENWTKTFEWVNFLPMELSDLVKVLNKNLRMNHSNIMRRQAKAITRFRDRLRLDDHRFWAQEDNLYTYVHHLKAYASMMNLYISQNQNILKKVLMELQKAEEDLTEVLEILLTV